MKFKLLHAFFYITSFVEGASLMSVEILSSKIIAPYYGASIYVWTAVLGFTLGGLALGYYFGGIISKADSSSYRRLILLIVASSVSVLVIPFTSEWILNLTLPLELRAGISISCLVFLFPSVVLFGMVSPLIIRYLSSDAATIGYSAGITYTISTTGGIIFTFLFGFYLISEIGIKASTLAVGLFILLPLPLYLIYKNTKIQVNE